MAFNPVSIIKKKRQGEALAPEEIQEFISLFTAGKIPDYQMSALLMAIYFQGMNPKETSQLVQTMLHSGSVVDMSDIKAPKVDKHSTGGIGDKTTLILAPLLASVGVCMPTISGRGLGHTGGTLDKMQAIPGFDVFLSLRRFKELTGNVGACFIGQTEEICPADRKIYALRDVTATVESLPLIVASIMSKKLAEGIDALVLDVKIGSGAFMKSKKEAEILAKALVDTAAQAGKKASALITDMSQPLGWCVGNAIEVNECVNFLRQGPQDSPVEKRLAEVTLALATELFLHAESIRGKKTSPAAAKETLLESLQNGKAYAKFLEIVSMQGGDTEAVDQGLPLAKKEFTLKSPQKGYLAQIDGEQIGYALIEMGGSRKKNSDTVLPDVGIQIHAQIGDEIRKDQPLATIYAKDSKSGEIARDMLSRAITVENSPTNAPKLIYGRI